MLKKLVGTALVVGLVGLLAFGRDAGSYVSTAVGRARETVKDAVPLEFEIQRTKQMLTDLGPDIHKNMERIAKEEVELERLERQIASLEQRLSTERGRLSQLAGELKTGKPQIQLAGRTYTAEQVKVDLSARFARFKVSQETLDSLRQMQTARQKSVAAARHKLEGMLASRRQLQVDLEHLGARLKMVEAQQATSEYAFDDSRLARIKDQVADLRARLDVAERLVGVEQYFPAEIPLDEMSGDVVAEVEAYLNGSPADDTVSTAEADEALAELGQ